MNPFLKCAIPFRLLLSTTLLFTCYGSNLKLSDTDSIASFIPRNIRHYSFTGYPTDVYISWDPPLNYLLPKSSDLSGNTANVKKGGDVTLNRLSVPLLDPSHSKSEDHPKYNVVDKNTHESTNGTYANPLQMNSTKNVTIKGDLKKGESQNKNLLGSVAGINDGRYDVYGFVDNYTIFYKQQQDPDMNFKRLHTRHTWVHLLNITAGTTYELYIRVCYSMKQQVNSTKYFFTLDTSNSTSAADCKCSSIGTKGEVTTCDLNSGLPCLCASGYGGLFCNQCRPKHYMHGKKCFPCPCNSQFGSFNCRLANNGVVCNCPVEYTSESCNKCANGYFSYYRMCAKCICNDNIDPQSPEICDPEIGACKHCLYNTTGFACNLCLPGFVGDPIRHKNCTKQDFSKSKILASRPKASFPLSLKIGLPLVIIFIFIVMGILFLQRHRFYHKLQPFWTIELKDDHDSVNLTPTNGQEFGGTSSSSHAASNHDDMDFYAKHHSGMQYSPLRETM